MKNTIKINFENTVGKIKPMHSVNNGPVISRGVGNADKFREIGVPFVRTHDASFFSGYGGSHSTDVNYIFPNFDADENDPSSYDFVLTDKYMRDIAAGGSKVFFRLGSKIEHEIKKYNTYPPKDFLKWAKICEHIILHYTEGWADGFDARVAYWEIWNEPDCANADGTNPCWQGTDEEFYDFFCVAFKHLKSKFPHLKIGGPAFCSSGNRMERPFLDRLKKENIKLDFYSFHAYKEVPRKFMRDTKYVRKLLDEYGMNETETVLDEWNYVCGWLGDDWKKTIKAEISIKGASFLLGTMITCQNSPLDHLMYYDARPCKMNGLFDFYTLDPLKGFYALKMFGDIYRLENEVESSADDGEHLFCIAAAKESEKCASITYFDDDDNAADREINLELNGLAGSESIVIYLTNEKYTMKEYITVSAKEGKTTIPLTLGNYDMIFIKICKQSQ